MKPYPWICTIYELIRGSTALDKVVLALIVMLTAYNIDVESFGNVVLCSGALLYVLWSLAMRRTSK